MIDGTEIAPNESADFTYTSTQGCDSIVTVIVAPIAVLSETPRLRYIDDNATMLLIPLAVVVTLEPFLNVM